MLRLLVSGGGTAGGVYPALAVAATLGERAEVLWVGGEGGMEAALVQREGIAFAAIPAAGVHGVGIRALPGNLLRLLRGTLAARRILARFRPQVIFLTGGYVGVPVGLAGLRVPKAVFVPDMQPALALRLLSRLAQLIAVTAEEARKHFGSRRRVMVSGYPVRPALVPLEKAQARRRMGMGSESPVLLVMGGSLGARSINQALWSCLPQALEHCQVIHLTGEADWAAAVRVQDELPEGLRGRYSPQAYLHEEMAFALSASDLAVSRAGASTLGEYPTFRLPAVLIPYPHAWRYQRSNAEYLVNRGAAVVLEDADLARDLLPTLRALLSDPGALESMATAMGRLARPGAAERIAEAILSLAAGEVG